MIERVTNVELAEQLTKLDNALLENSHYNENQFLQMIQDVSYTIWVDIEDGNLNAYAVIYHNYDFDELFKIGVREDKQRLGLGTKLLKFIIAQSDKSLLLEVSSKNEKAVAFYKSFGFTQNGIRKNYYGQNEDGILMEFK